MNSPYKYHLERLTGQTVTIDRNGASSVKGSLHEILEAGCVIKQPIDGEEVADYTFVAYGDMRGVTTRDHDYSQIG